MRCWSFHWCGREQKQGGCKTGQPCKVHHTLYPHTNAVEKKIQHLLLLECIYFFCTAKEVDVGSLPSLEIHWQAGGAETDRTARKYWYYFVWCRFFEFYTIHHVNINPTFIWGRHAALISSTVRSDRAKPTKYVSPGSRPSLNSHLQEGQCESKAASWNSSQGSNSSEHTKRL